MKPFVKVVWHDAADEAKTWLREDELDDASIEVISFGYLLRKTRSFLHLAGDCIVGGLEDITYGRVCKIPRKMVVSVEEIVIPEVKEA